MNGGVPRGQWALSIWAMVGWNLEPHVDASWLQTAGCLVALLQASSKLAPDCNPTALRCHCFAKEREANNARNLLNEN